MNPDGTAPPATTSGGTDHEHDHNVPQIQSPTPNGRGPVKRTVFATSRAAEFLELRALQAQTGQPAGAFGHVVVKELLDNALDGAESAGAAPIVGIDTRTENGVTLVTVTDNGAGIAPATVNDLCDFNVLVSDKARYRGPSRGAQGNAAKTLFGIPCALDVDEPVIIESHGIRHELRVSIDRVGDVVVTHDATIGGRTVGASVTVPLPEELELDAWRWAYAAALVNPHATISVIDHAYSDADSDTVFYKPSDRSWSKWTPSAPSSPHWYDGAAFAALVYAYIREIDRTGVDVPLGAFITEFDGLSGSVKQKAIRTAAAGVTHLSGLDGRDEVITALHDAMLHHAKPTPAGRLGPVGADHYKSMLDAEYALRRFWFKTKTVTVDGVPWIIEVAVADTVKPGHIWFACNHAPAFGDPLGRAHLSAGDVNVFGAASFLTAADANADDAFHEAGNRTAVVHVICAATQFVDKGKVALVVPPAVADAASAALDGATKTLRREAQQRRKDARKAARAAQRARDEAWRAQQRDQWTLKDAVFEVLPDAKAAAGDVVAARTLYYKVRPRIQQLTEAELGYRYFSQTLLPEFERTVQPLPGLYYEARGALHHPHDADVIPLGTREVEDYTPPPWQFDKLLYVEKTGLEAQLAPYQLGQRYDMAVIYGKGYAVTACRTLLARSDIREMTILVLHDADLDGYNIARTLAEATRRMPRHSIDVIDLGLTVPQAITHGLQTENFTRKKELPAGLELDPVAREWFTGQPIPVGYGKFHYTCRRCELNAFSADELAEFIEAGLRDHGAATKLVPPGDVLAQNVAAVRAETVADLVADELARMVDIGDVVGRLLDGHNFGGVDQADVRDSFIADPTRSWRSVARQLVVEDIRAAADTLAADVRAQLHEQLSTNPGGNR
jgi:DNA topoisomerase VI subunit B